MKERYRSYSSYLRERYGVKVYRVSLDAGFSCPHRDPGLDLSGCTFCEGTGGRSPYLEGFGRSEARQRAPADVSRTSSPAPPAAVELCDRLLNLQEQVAAARAFLSRRYKAERLILYFQAYTSTYAGVEELKQVYDHALSLAPFCEMVVSTRPDCVDPHVVDLLRSYQRPDFRVWVELGLQSAHDETLARINRGHTVSQFAPAFRRLTGAGLAVAVHLIFGLPGEGRREIMETVDYVAALHPQGLKIHNLHISNQAAILGEYLAGEITTPGSARHLRYVADAIERMPRDTVVMRVTADTPAPRLVSPRQFWEKSEFYRRLAAELEARDSYQGCRLGS